MLALVVLLHVAVLAPMPSCAAPPPPAAPPAMQSSELVVLADITPGLDGEQCAYAYDGLGIMITPSGEVLQVARNGPAWIAGIREGDTLENAESFTPDTLPVGTRLPIYGAREGKHYTAVVIIGKVCQL